FGRGVGVTDVHEDVPDRDRVSPALARDLDVSLDAVELGEGGDQPSKGLRRLDAARLSEPRDPGLAGVGEGLRDDDPDTSDADTEVDLDVDDRRVDVARGRAEEVLHVLAWDVRLAEHLAHATELTLLEQDELVVDANHSTVLRCRDVVPPRPEELGVDVWSEVGCEREATVGSFGDE